MKPRIYENGALVRVTVTISPEAHEWLSDRSNMQKLREILDEKLGTNTQRRDRQA